MRIETLFKKIKRTIFNANKELEKKFKNEKWMQILLECQEDILKYNPSDYYVNSYREYEKCYWINIPKWIYSDFENIQVEKILDIGSGYGTLALFCQKLFHPEIFCIDFASSNLSKSLIEDKNIHFQVNNIEIDEFPWDDKFDIIIFTEVLEHLNFNPKPTLKKIHSLLKTNGRLYLSTPDASEWGRVTKYYKNPAEMPNPKKDEKIIDDHIYQYKKEELLKILDDVGFKIIKLSYSPGVIDRHFNLVLKRN